MAAARAFGMVRMNRAAFDSRDRVFNEAGFIQGIGMDGDLDVVPVGDAQAAIDGSGRRAPVFV